MFGHVEKWLDEKANINFEIYGATDWMKNNHNTHTAQYLKN